jgi:GntR family transcriptional regulator/MocR family aminotransferase
MVQKLRPWKTAIHLNLDGKRAIYRQVADGIVSEIKKGRLLPGTPLPGTRQLAEDLSVNRKTIVMAFEELIAEGWLSSAYKKGTFVSEKLPLTTVTYRQKKQPVIMATSSFKQPDEGGLLFKKERTRLYLMMVCRM